MNRRTTGSQYEEYVAAYLIGKGYKILERNFRCRQGEIDIVAESPEGTLVYCEIKYRGSAACGDPLEAVDRRKQKKMSQSALLHYAQYGRGGQRPCRFDVIGVDGCGKVRHIENAFEFQL